MSQSGTWVAGPDIPNGLGSYDGSAVVLSNGKVLCAVGPKSGDGPTTFVESTRSRTSSPTRPTCRTIPLSPSRPASSPSPTAMSFSPMGRISLTSTSLEADRAASWRPTITQIRRNHNGSFHLTGTQLNGVSEGAYYGDDAQMSSNYPIVRLSDASHHVYYARTTNWTIGVATRRKSVSTDFTLPGTLPTGKYRLSVVANGIASRPSRSPTTPDIEEPRTFVPSGWRTSSAAGRPTFPGLPQLGRPRGHELRVILEAGFGGAGVLGT